jgi:hypothetical protein
MNDGLRTGLTPEVRVLCCRTALELDPGRVTSTPTSGQPNNVRGKKALVELVKVRLAASLDRAEAERWQRSERTLPLEPGGSIATSGG